LKIYNNNLFLLKLRRNLKVAKNGNKAEIEKNIKKKIVETEKLKTKIRNLQKKSDNFVKANKKRLFAVGASWMSPDLPRNDDAAVLAAERISKKNLLNYLKTSQEDEAIAIRDYFDNNRDTIVLKMFAFRNDEKDKAQNISMDQILDFYVTQYAQYVSVLNLTKNGRSQNNFVVYSYLPHPNTAEFKSKLNGVKSYADATERKNSELYDQKNVNHHPYAILQKLDEQDKKDFKEKFYYRWFHEGLGIGDTHSGKIKAKYELLTNDDIKHFANMIHDYINAKGNIEKEDFTVADLKVMILEEQTLWADLIKKNFRISWNSMEKKWKGDGQESVKKICWKKEFLEKMIPFYKKGVSLYKENEFSDILSKYPVTDHRAVFFQSRFINYLVNLSKSDPGKFYKKLANPRDLQKEYLRNMYDMQNTERVLSSIIAGDRKIKIKIQEEHEKFYENLPTLVAENSDNEVTIKNWVDFRKNLLRADQSILDRLKDNPVCYYKTLKSMFKKENNKPFSERLESFMLQVDNTSYMKRHEISREGQAKKSELNRVKLLNKVLTLNSASKTAHLSYRAKVFPAKLALPDFRVRAAYYKYLLLSDKNFLKTPLKSNHNFESISGGESALTAFLNEKNNFGGNAKVSCESSVKQILNSKIKTIPKAQEGTTLDEKYKAYVQYSLLHTLYRLKTFKINKESALNYKKKAKGLFRNAKITANKANIFQACVDDTIGGGILDFEIWWQGGE